MAQNPLSAQLLLQALGAQAIDQRAREAMEITSHHSVLGDVFDIQKLDNGGYKIVVRQSDQSSILKGHLRDMPIVPFVVLKKLYLEIFKHDMFAYDIDAEMVGGMVLPGMELTVREDGIYT